LSDQVKSREKRMTRNRADKCKGWNPVSRGMGNVRIIEVDPRLKPEDQTRH
jgi:hypothetical protein